MYNITVSEEIKKACPVFKGAAVYAEVTNSVFSQGLWDEINAFTKELTTTTEPLPPLGRSITPPSYAGIGVVSD